ncbi:MAG: condensation domain-containing protein, partial [Micromonosporaceae bacterium]
ALAEVVRRHESLRTSFVTRGGVPVQVVEEGVVLPLVVVDVEGPESEVRARAVVEEEARRRFDLRRGPLVRAVLVRLGAADHVLVVTVHHIVSDGWSAGVLVRELCVLYEAFSRGAPSPLPELAVQYADFALWQRRRLTGPVLDRLLAYWRERLDGATVVDLPTDRPRPPVPSYRGATHRLELDAVTTEALRRLCRQEGVTLFMVLVAAYAVVLARWSGQDDLVIGAPIANRNRVELEGLIGFFVNTLPLRLDLSGDPTFAELLTRVRHSTLGAYAHQDLPFDRLVEELHPQRDPTRTTPIVGSLFHFDATAVPLPPLADLTTEPWEIDKQTARTDQTWTLWENEGTIAGVVEYATDLFDPETVAAVAEAFTALAGSLAADPDTELLPISRALPSRVGPARATGRR